ncbi:hypothetical protein AACH10_21405 [Ideonella sp. DXS22W]|uniref:LysR substrate-binding domain-containing protein n=1 Tax=Pseudaquabacterium inlustre TaxID=2984192 RepID=A0ABU9CQF2_9BURK
MAGTDSLGITRRIAATSFGFVALPALVPGTELIATAHRRLARRLAAACAVELRPLPLDIPPMTQNLQWHGYRTQDPGLVWLRALLHRAARRMDAGSV